jgi:SAM-dependent methyltransferase
MARTPTSAAAYWDDAYRRNGRRVIATRTGGLTYEESGERDGRMILDLAHLQPPLGDVLEIGSGDGRISQWFPPQARSVTCLEPAERIASQCRVALSRFPNATVLVGNVDELAGLPSHSFDLIFSCFVLQHVPNQREVREYLSESVRLVRRDGRIVHHLRRAGAGVVLRQTAIDLARLPTGMPKFSPYWRGCRMKPAALERTVAQLTTARYELRRDSIHLWLTIFA